MSDDGGRNRKQPQLPKMDFATFVMSLSHSAMVHLGDAAAPGDAAQPPDLALARQTIDILELLADKTKGNLTGEEERLLHNILYEMQMRYVEVVGERGSR